VPGDQELGRHQRPVGELESVFHQAEDLIAQGQAREAIELLKPMLESHPRAPDLHYYLGYAHAKAGDMWTAINEYEQTMKLRPDPGLWLPLASLYLGAGLHLYALRAFRRVLEQPLDFPGIEGIRATVISLEQDIAAMTRSLGISTRRAEEGLLHLEAGQRALHRRDYPACIAANQRAIKALGDWPPPHNNLSLALFFDGQPEKAIATAQKVLAHDPNNVQALGNAIRFLAWTGDEAEARVLWARLKEIAPRDPGERLKMAEAAAILDEDESVYQLLRPLDESGRAQAELPELSGHVQLLLAIAEANTGRHEARRRLRALRNYDPHAGEFFAALKAGRPGPNWAERFPYFHPADLLPEQRIKELGELAVRKDKMRPRLFRREVERFVARFPQIIEVAEKLIWEENQPEAGVIILQTIATPAANAVLRRLGLSQVGPDNVRMEVLLGLLNSGEIKQDTMLQVWQGGEWRTVQLHSYEISDRPQKEYTREVAELLDRGGRAFQRGDLDKAERLFKRALELEPRAHEAYNNLGTVYTRRGEHERAKDAFRAAIEIEPTYAFPRCNLVLYLLDEEDIEGAAAMLKPLANKTHFHPQEMAFYSYTQARIFAARKEYEAARQALKTALEIFPDYEPAEEMLARLEVMGGFESMFERQHQRNQAARARLQTKLSTPVPTLSEALSLYSKDVLTATAHRVIPGGGWSGLRKAELLQEIVKWLGDQDNLKRVVAELGGDEQTALRQVLALKGTMPWQDFDARFGNDLQASPYWQWHTPETIMGRLRERGLLVEATVSGTLQVVVPADLRPGLRTILD
jgi:tetratricopeptide (TPR) repeat protein